MNTFYKSKLLALSLYCGLAVLPLRSMADDIDIFLGSSGGAAAAPKVMIMLDNSTDDLFTAKLNAISSVLDSITAAAPVSVGLAMWSPGT
ncbi:MAG TPA: hypothetical protein VGO51_17365, partial [Burkholderiaceae bacterium]|nr:hypothetical protein [Burkholderiaceae bacterium]